MILERAYPEKEGWRCPYGDGTVICIGGVGQVVLPPCTGEIVPCAPKTSRVVIQYPT